MSSQDEVGKQDGLLVGRVFQDRFQILSLLGVGGVGVVYKAKHTHMDRIVAIKMLTPFVVSNDENSFLRFEQEARAASALTHPNIISIYDFGKSVDGRAYLVMEYLGTKSLESVLKSEGALDLDRFLRIFSQICEGLQHAHRKGVIHRDIKPSNVMLVDTEEASNVVKIVDFGLAKLTAGDVEQHLTKTGTILGTPLYMSPEQCRGLELDHRSDIYSLGCLMYAALTGRVPVKGENALDTMYKHMVEPPTPFSVTAPQLALPEPLEQAILKAMQKDASDRQQSMTELRNDITDAIYSRSHQVGSAQRSAATERSRSKEISGLSPAGVEGEELSRTIDVSHSSEYRATFQPPTPAPAVVNGPRSMTGNTRKTDDLEPPATGGSSKKLRERSNSQPPLPVQTAAAVSAVVALIGAIVIALNWRQPAPVKQPAPRQQTSIESTQAPSAPTSTPPRVGPRERRLPAGTTRVPSNALASATPPSPVIPAHPPRISPLLVPQRTAAGRPRTGPLARLQPKDHALAKSEDLARAREFRMRAKELFDSNNWRAARSLYFQCLSAEERAYGPRDPHLVPTLARMISCSLSAKEGALQIKPYLDVALEIFNKRRQEAADSVNQMNRPLDVWSPLARGSAEVADQSAGSVRSDYLGWSADFYDLALKAWQGPKQDPQYRKLASDYCAVLEQCGDSKRAAAVRREAGLPAQQSVKQRVPPAHPRRRRPGRGIWQR